MARKSTKQKAKETAAQVKRPSLIELLNTQRRIEQQIEQQKQAKQEPAEQEPAEQEPAEQEPVESA